MSHFTGTVVCTVNLEILGVSSIITEQQFVFFFSNIVKQGGIVKLQYQEKVVVVCTNDVFQQVLIICLHGLCH